MAAGFRFRLVDAWGVVAGFRKIEDAIAFATWKTGPEGGMTQPLTLTEATHGSGTTVLEMFRDGRALLNGTPITTYTTHHPFSKTP